MKKFIGIFTVFGMIFCSSISAHEELDETYYTEDDDELFNHGKFVGKENDEYLKRIRNERNKNWAIALTSTALSVTTAALLGKSQHDKKLMRKERKQAKKQAAQS